MNKISPKVVLTLGGICALVLVAVWIVSGAADRNAPRIAPMSEPLRSSSLTSSQRVCIATELAEMLRFLASTSSQRRYDEYIPLVCERASKLMWYALPYDWARSIKPDLAKGPVLNILAGRDTHPIKAAAFLAGSFHMEEATPLMIDLLTTRFAGSEWPRFQSQSVLVHAVQALARMAAHGDRKAGQFLITYANADAWRNISYGVADLDQAGSAEFVWYRLVGNLVYYPCEDSIRVLQESEYEWKENRVALIRAYLASGDSIEEYYREIQDRGILSNKYVQITMSNAPGIASSTTWVGRTTKVQILHGTNGPSRIAPINQDSRPR